MRPKQVMLCKPSQSVSTEEIGVRDYAHTRSNWKIIVTGNSPQDLLRTFREWKIEGGIGIFDKEAAAVAAAELKIPFVHIGDGEPLGGLPMVGTDPWACGRMGADHLANLGLKRFLYVPWKPVKGLRDQAICRWEGFYARLLERGLTEVTPLDYHQTLPKSLLRKHLYYSEEALIRYYLQLLQLPLGVFCCADVMAVIVSDICHNLPLRIPDEVAILGVGNSLQRCLLADPPLSSIELPNQEVGYEAAHMLDQLLAGHPIRSPLYLPPKSCVVRGSSDILAIADPEVVTALRYIRQHAPEGLRVQDVVEQTTLSQGVLQQRFRWHVGQNIFAEIRRVQIERVQHLLRDTDLTLDQIAEKTGFSLGLRLNREFKNKTGQTPMEYRRQFRHT